jgi:hypothetical protein
MAIYAVYDQSGVLLSTSKSRKGMAENLKTAYMPIVREWQHLTETQVRYLSYTQATFFEHVMKESIG